MVQNDKHRRTWTIWKPLGIGIFSLVFLVGVLGVWGTKANISGAVIAKGKVQVSSTRTALQHPTGGVVAEVLAENGHTVEAGDVVVRLDDTRLRSELNIVEGELFEALANEARLEALIDDREELTLHPLLREAAHKDAGIGTLLDRQRRQLALHYDSLDTQSRLFAEQIKQVEKQIVGVEAELAAQNRSKEFIENELERASGLLKRGLIKLQDHRKLEKELIATQGEIGKLTAKVAELKGKISEFKLKLHALSPALKEKAVEKLSKLRPLKTKFLEKRNHVLYGLSKLEIRAPISGTVHDSKILGLQSVVVAASPLMYVVPNREPVSVAARVDTSDIDQIYSGQKASLRFRAFNRRSTPIIQGEVTNISADAFVDETTKMQFYNVEISIPEGEIEKLGERHLISGMPVDAFITTKSRSPITYITKPVMDYFDRAFRDPYS